MKLKISILITVVLCMLFSYDTEGQSGSENKNNVQVQKDGNWISIFNGKDLDGWIPKVTGYKPGENPLDLFHVENGILEVDYSKFNRFNSRFG